VYNVEVLIFGALAGFALGLTGGGGAVLAVPLLVYGLAVDAPQAVAISLMAVGGAAIAGFVNRLRRGEVDLRAGSFFALGGVVTAPVGAWLGERMPETLLLSLFGILIAGVAVRMWIISRRDTPLTTGPCAASGRLTRTCVAVLTVSGMATGILSGLFGVGGGFVVVPALVFATGMGMHRAVATSLMVVAVVSSAALGSILVTGREVPWTIAVLFLLGSIAGMATGTALGRIVSGPRLQQAFAVALVLVGVLITAESLAV
jgi:hypothetical protein